VVVGFELKMGNRTGTMSLCIPYNAIEPIMGTLAAQNWFSYQRKGGMDDHVRKLTRNVTSARVEARAFLAQTTITMNDLLALQVGDVITTEKRTTSDVVLQVEGKAKFQCEVGQVRGNRAVKVMRVVQLSAEPTNPDGSAASPIPSAAAAVAQTAAPAMVASPPPPAKSGTRR